MSDHRSAPTHPRPLLWLALLACLLAALVQAWLLRGMAYSKATMSAVSSSEALSPSDPMVLAGLSWHPAPYLGVPSLEPVRQVVRQHCPGQAGHALAVCLSDLFARRFAHGTPKREFFDRVHDPVASFQAHLAGEPGHCVSRSGMLALALLATGTPGRVAQVVGRDGDSGHNVIEVWEPGHGWQVVDPSFAGKLEAADGRTSAVALTLPPFPRWRDQTVRTKVPGVDESLALREYQEQRLQASLIIYPEPWLYTRVGSASAPWPFQGRFVVVGERTLAVGLGQTLLQAGMLISMFGGAAMAILILWRRRSGWLAKRRRLDASFADEPPAPVQSTS